MLLAGDGTRGDVALPRVLAVVVYNGSERWTAIGGEGHLAPVPSARAERDLAPLRTPASTQRRRQSPSR